MLRIKIILLLILLLFPAVGWAENFCVSTGDSWNSAACASDCAAEVEANTCMDAADFNTGGNWDTDDDLIGPGDTVYFSGTFTSTSLYPQGSGTIGNSITFDGYEAGDCDALGTSCSNSAVMSASNFSGSTKNYLIYKDFVFTNQAYVDCAVNDNPSCSFINSCSGESIDNTCKTTGITITNNRFETGGHSYGSAIAIGFVTDWAVTNNYYEGDGFCTIGQVWHYGSREHFIGIRPGGSRGRVVNNHVIDSFNFNYTVLDVNRNSRVDSILDFPSSGSYTKDPEANITGLEVAYNLYDGWCEEGISFDDPSGESQSDADCTALDEPYDCCTGDGTGTCTETSQPESHWPAIESDTISTIDAGNNYIYLDNTGGEWTGLGNLYSGFYLVNATVGNEARYASISLIEAQSENRFTLAEGETSKFLAGDTITVSLIENKVWVHHNRMIVDEGAEYGWGPIWLEGGCFNGLIENNYVVPSPNWGCEEFADKECISQLINQPVHGGYYNPLGVTQTATHTANGYNLYRYNIFEGISSSNYYLFTSDGWDFTYNSSYIDNMLWGTGDEGNVLFIQKAYSYYSGNTYENNGDPITVTVHPVHGGGLQDADSTTGVPAAIYSQSHIGPNILATATTGTLLTIEFTEAITGCYSGNCGFSITDDLGSVSLEYLGNTDVLRHFTLGRSLDSNAVLFYDGTGIIIDSDTNPMYAWSVTGHDLSTEYTSLSSPFFISNALPADGAEGQSDSLTITWTNPADTLETLFYIDTVNGTTLEDSGSVETSYVPSLDEDTTYYWRVDIRHAAGTETGIVRTFTTSGSPPPVAAASGLSFSKKGTTLKFSSKAGVIKR